MNRLARTTRGTSPTLSFTSTVPVARGVTCRRGRHIFVNATLLFNRQVQPFYGAVDDGPNTKDLKSLTYGVGIAPRQKLELVG